jgi:hypothetical protein
MEFSVQRQLYNACDPSKPLDAFDARYVDIDRVGEGGAVRGERWSASFRRRVELSEEPICELLTGLPGSGKSTELKRLAAELEDPHRHKLLAVYVSAEDYLDLTSELDVPDLLASVVDAVERRQLEVEGKAGPPHGESYLVRLWNWLTRTDIEFGKGELQVKDAAKLAIELKTRPTLRQRMRQAVAQQLPAFLAEVNAELLRLKSRATSAGYEGIVVLFDSLEKLRGISANYAEVLDSCERVFAGSPPYVKLPVHVVYTVPPALLSRARVRVEFFPMLKLRTRAGKLFEPGLAAAREIALKRVPESALTEQLGPDWDARLHRLLLWSGGYPRDILRMLRSVIERERTMTDAEFERLLSRTTGEYRDLIHRSEHEWLARVAVYQELSTDDEEQRRIADRMLYANAVLRYVNDEDWWDLHPAVREIAGVRDALSALQALHSQR